MAKERDGKMRLIPFEEALARLVRAVEFELPAETVKVAASLGRTLRENVKAGFDIPPFDKSAMDGYAAIARDLLGASPEKPVVLQVLEDLPAGKNPARRLGRGQASRIMTGAPLPRGADAVVMVEDTERGEGVVKIFRGVSAGDNCGRAGEDAKKGAAVLGSGALIGPAQMGMLAALGRKSVKVSRRPRIMVISTGDEVLAPGTPRKPGRIYDANGYSLTGLALRHGCEAKFLGIARDRPGELKKKLAQTANADVVLLTGGVSVGDYDFVTGLLRGIGGQEIFYKSAIQPGKPTFAAIKGKQLFFGLPGNPVSAMVCFELFVRPALDLIKGAAEIGAARSRAKMEAEVKVKPGRKKFLRGRVVGRGPEVVVRAFRDQKSGVLSSMMDSDVLIEVDGAAEGLQAGQEVTVRWLTEDRSWRN